VYGPVVAVFCVCLRVFCRCCITGCSKVLLLVRAASSWMASQGKTLLLLQQHMLSSTSSSSTTIARAPAAAAVHCLRLRGWALCWLLSAWSDCTQLVVTAAGLSCGPSRCLLRLTLRMSADAMERCPPSCTGRHCSAGPAAGWCY
jgi:hypothetical protein